MPTHDTVEGSVDGSRSAPRTVACRPTSSARRAHEVNDASRWCPPGEKWTHSCGVRSNYPRGRWRRGWFLVGGISSGRRAGASSDSGVLGDEAEDVRQPAEKCARLLRACRRVLRRRGDVNCATEEPVDVPTRGRRDRSARRRTLNLSFIPDGRPSTKGGSATRHVCRAYKPPASVRRAPMTKVKCTV